MISTVHLAIFMIILGLTVILRTFTNKRTNLPPGPKGKFLIGNSFDPSFARSTRMAALAEA